MKNEEPIGGRDKTNLEYSEYDDRIKKYENWLVNVTDHFESARKYLRDAEETFSRAQTAPAFDGEVDICRASMEIYRDMVESDQRMINKLKILIEKTKELKAAASKFLERGEHLDPVTADIEIEDKPPRQVN